MTITQNIYINSFACFSLQWNTHFALMTFLFHKKDVYDTQNKRPWDHTNPLGANCVNYKHLLLQLSVKALVPLVLVFFIKNNIQNIWQEIFTLLQAD